jgi:hypothetical protein
MDVIRYASEQPAYFFNNSDETATLRWFAASPGARAFPTNHAFGSPVWDGDYGQAYVGPGIHTTERIWVKSINPGCPGTVPPQDLIRFKRGLLPSDGPLPPCCSGAFFAGGGGGGMDGKSLFNYCPHLCANAGTMCDGSGYGGRVFYASGGMSGDGSAGMGVTAGFISSGGTDGDGEAILTHT